MGLFSNLFGVKPAKQQPPQLQSILPAMAEQELYNGLLPMISVDTIILNTGEACRFVDVAAIVIEKTHYKSSRVGGSYRVFKGFTVHSGNSTSVPVTDIEYTQGVLHFTDKRVIFVAPKNGFEKQIKNLSAVSQYADGIDLQFGSKAFSLLLPNAAAAKCALDLIVR
ncbi:MAG: hypothetical protein J1G38_04965 [Clostridiales bacterium]|nr:hypothetical protein [Clostridiales bacterium]